MRELAERLTNEFIDKDYAHAYMEEHGNMLLAAQIKVLREQRGLTQAQLAELADMKQERISALENVDYDAWTIKTLRKLAKAFDTGLQTSFVPVGTAIMGIVNVTRDSLKVLPRTEDLESFRRHRIVMSGGHWKAIDGSHLAPVESIVPSQPVQPRKTWQSLVGATVFAAHG